MAISYALEWAGNNAINNITLFSDSTTAITQLTNDRCYGVVRNPKLRSLVTKIWDIIVANNLDVTFSWISREENPAGKILESIIDIGRDTRVVKKYSKYSQNLIWELKKKIKKTKYTTKEGKILLTELDNIKEQILKAEKVASQIEQEANTKLKFNYSEVLANLKRNSTNNLNDLLYTLKKLTDIEKEVKNNG